MNRPNHLRARRSSVLVEAFALWGAILALLAPWVLTGMSQPARSGSAPMDQFQSLLNIKLQTDVRIFAVMAAINVAGFDFEQEGQDHSPTRRAVRERLSRENPEIRRKLRNFYEAHLPGQSQRDQQAAYISLALHLGPPPEFNLALDDQTPKDVRALAGFELLVRDFFLASDLNQLWAEYRPAYERALVPYRELVSDVARETLSYFRIPSRVALDRQILLSPDLLNARNIVNARNRENIYHIVVGPADSADLNFSGVQHEYLHSLIDPLIQKHGARLLQERAALEISAIQPNFRPALRDNFLLVVSESLIASILLRLHPRPDPTAEVDRLYLEGLILTPFFLRELEKFEKDDLATTMPVYLETMFDRIRRDTIEQDGLALGRWRDEQQLALEEQQERVDAANRIRTIFNRGVGHLARQETDEAEAAFRELLQIDPDHEKALFNLGEILTMRAQQGPETLHFHEEASRLYLRISQLPSSTPATLARSLLRIGRYAASRGDFQAARIRFNQVLELRGDLDKEVAEARDLIERLPSN